MIKLLLSGMIQYRDKIFFLREERGNEGSVKRCIKPRRIKKRFGQTCTTPQGKGRRHTEYLEDSDLSSRWFMMIRIEDLVGKVSLN